MVKDTAILRDVLDAAAFFASSMGRVCSDFQCLLAPMFEEQLADIVIKHWSDGLEALDVTLSLCRDAGIAGPLTSTASTSEMFVGEVCSDLAGDNTPQDDISDTGTPPPPRQLLAHPPLARFVNAFLAGLNEVRRCLLPGSFQTLRLSSLHILDEVDGLLQANERAVLTPGLRGEVLRLRETASQMRTCWIDGREYCRLALEVAIGNIERGRVTQKRAIEGEAKTETVDAETTLIG